MRATLRDRLELGESRREPPYHSVLDLTDEERKQLN
jgi:hypothetical protein